MHKSSEFPAIDNDVAKLDEALTGTDMRTHRRVEIAYNTLREWVDANYDNLSTTDIEFIQPMMAYAGQKLVERKDALCWSGISFETREREA